MLSSKPFFLVDRLRTFSLLAAYGLSFREREVVDLVVRGVSRKQISAMLYISEYTVQDHLSNVFDKVGVRGPEALIKHLFLHNLYPAMMPPELRRMPLFV